MVVKLFVTVKICPSFHELIFYIKQTDVKKNPSSFYWPVYNYC